MGTRSILQLAQDAADELSLARPDALVGVTDDNTAQKLYRHLIRSVKWLAVHYDWQLLRKEKTHTTLAAAAQTGAIPSDFLRFVDGSFWNRSTKSPVSGPLTAQEWQALQASTITRVTDAFYVRGGVLYLSPTPAAGETLSYEYIKNAIGTDTTGATDRTAFTVDTDLTYFDDELVVLEMAWRYRKAEGEDYAEEHREAQLRAANLIGHDGGKRTLDMGRPTERIKPRAPVIPETLTF